MKTIQYFILIFISLHAFHSYGQVISIGDSAIVNSIQSKASSIYETKSTPLFFLTKQLQQKPKSYGTNIIAYVKEDTINRIVTSATTPEGILSTEYYLDKEQLIFAYITFEYFDEVKTINTMKNFKGIKSWESRYYFSNEQVKYQKHAGIIDALTTYSPAEVLNDKRKILNYVKGKIKKDSSITFCNLMSL